MSPITSPQICFITVHSDVLSWAQSCGITLADSQWLEQYLSLVRSGIVGTSAVVVPTHWMMQTLANLYPLPQTKIVIPNGRSISPSDGEIRTLQAIAAGRLWDPAKDLSLLTDVRSLIPILVAGEIEHESSIAPRDSGSFELLGNLPEDQLLELFLQSAIYLCASIYVPFGLAPLEAALCGCAVLARDIPYTMYGRMAHSTSRTMHLFLRFCSAFPRNRILSVKCRSVRRGGRNVSPAIAWFSNTSQFLK